ncbi:MAG: hypothetical protein JNK85_22635 [Verrucomicrobiales bacterium]|nr:hypothetical protein [Verrucomicrobiales bacterium]
MAEPKVPEPFFPETKWSTIIELPGADSEAKSQALERLLTRYRQPIFRHIQKVTGCDPESAEDLTHGFILQSLRLDAFERASREKGRFRTYIKACVQHFLNDQRDREEAAKRGRRHQAGSLDETDEEGNPRYTPAAPLAEPGLEVDREWALRVLERALEALRQQCVSARQGALFDVLEGQLGLSPERRSLDQIAAQTGMNKNALTVAAHRMRARLGELIREEVRQLVASEEDVQDELRYLVDLLGR